MDLVLRAVAVYLLVLVVFRVAGKRALSDMTTFDLVLTLIISEAIQEALLDNDHSLTGAAILVVTLVGLDVVMSVLKHRVPMIEKLVDSVPVVLVENGVLRRDRM